MASIHLDIITSITGRQQGDNLKQLNRCALWLLTENSISLKIQLPDSFAICGTRECIRFSSSKIERENCKTFWTHNYYNNYSDKIQKIIKVVICPELKIYSRIYHIYNISMTNVGT